MSSLSITLGEATALAGQGFQERVDLGRLEALLGGDDEVLHVYADSRAATLGRSRAV